MSKRISQKGNEKTADSVYINGNIYTMNDKDPRASAIAIRRQKLIYVGDTNGANDFIGTNTKVIDLKGKTVLPGLIEGHMHFPLLSENLFKIDGFWKPKAEILEAVRWSCCKYIKISYKSTVNWGEPRS